MGDDALTTVEGLLAPPDDSAGCELIRGRLREGPRRPQTYRHGETSANLGHLLRAWQERQPRPRPVVGLGAGFLLRRDPDTLITSDLSVTADPKIGKTRWSQIDMPGPPILAVEIIEPWVTHGEIVERIREYLAAGSVFWEVDPDFRRVSVHRPGHEPEMFNASQELHADPYLPGFRAAVAAIFDD